MSRGYIKLWRKVLDNEVLRERGKRYSRLEAWIYLCLNARGTDDPKTGLKRGEFAYSGRFLAAAWNWSRGAVEHFLEDLAEGPDPMIQKIVSQQKSHFLSQSVSHFIICNYETYNTTEASNRATPEASKKAKLKEGIKESIKTEDSCEPAGHEVVSPRALLDLYSKNNQKLPQVKAFTPDRADKCRARINQATRDGCLSQYLEDFAEAVRKAQSSPFLRGEGDRGWRANFDWLVANHRNIYAILEGKYDGLVKSRNNGDLKGSFDIVRRRISEQRRNEQRPAEAERLAGKGGGRGEHRAEPADD